MFVAVLAVFPVLASLGSNVIIASLCAAASPLPRGLAFIRRRWAAQKLDSLEPPNAMIDLHYQSPLSAFFTNIQLR